MLAPIESSVIPLPHQIRALSQAIANQKVRYLLADEVGLGKTIEAGLIMRELKLRGMVKRTLVIAPKGLVNQWVAEMQTHFQEHFQLVFPENIKTLSHFSAILRADDSGLSRGGQQIQGLKAALAGSQFSALNPQLSNPWQLFPQTIVPMDSVKPLDRRRGWGPDQVAEYNREHFEDLISAGWDLIIVDEAHRLAGATEQVARFKLGKGLSESAPYFLLLTATPHQGKTEAFHRLLSLLDDQAFPDSGSVTRERIRPYVIRTEKRRAIDPEGKPLFKPRQTELFPVSWEDRHQDQQRLYEEVTEYVREGYNQAVREKRSYVGFLMILMQRLVISSTSAIKATMARRLEVLKNEDSGLRQTQLFEDESFTQSSALSPDDYYDLDAQEQVDLLLSSRLKGIKNERATVKLLLEAAARCDQAGPDAKAEALLGWIYRLQAEEGDPNLKILIFTEFVPTQDMLHRFLADRGFQSVTLNGSMSLEERKKAQDQFAGDSRFLISTDAGGEGLNLQFCHVVINYDLPWNPMRLEQRIGRVDRIGQNHRVKAVNFVLEDSVEYRVREVLEEKLKVIFQEFGIDKTGDVLDSAQAGRIFNDLYLEAHLHPEKIEASVSTVITQVEEQVREYQETALVLGTTEDLKGEDVQRLLTHPLPYWVERMTVSYLRARGGKAESKGKTWDLLWPDGERIPEAVFLGKTAEAIPTARHLTLEDPRIRNLVERLPRFVPGQPVPAVSLPGLADEIDGFWSLWQISLSGYDLSDLGIPENPGLGNTGPERPQKRFLPLFISTEGKTFQPTARHVWDQLLSTDPVIQSFLDPEASRPTYANMHREAEEQGRMIYEMLLQEHREQITREKEKAEQSFSSRRKVLDKIGLPQVRQHRLKLMAREEQAFFDGLERKTRVYPELTPLLFLRLKGVGHE